MRMRDYTREREPFMISMEHETTSRFEDRSDGTFYPLFLRRDNMPQLLATLSIDDLRELHALLNENMRAFEQHNRAFRHDGLSSYDGKNDGLACY